MVHFWNGTIVPEYFRKVPSIWFEIYSRMTNTKWHVSSKIHNQIHLDIKLSKEAGLPQLHLFIFSKKATLPNIRLVVFQCTFFAVHIYFIWNFLVT